MLAALLVVEELKLVYLCRGGEGGGGSAVRKIYPKAVVRYLKAICINSAQHKYCITMSVVHQYIEIHLIN